MEGEVPSPVVPPTPPAATPAVPEFKVPEAYANKSWAGGVKSVDDLWKMNDNAQQTIVRQGIKLPGQDAKPEDIAAWKKDVMVKHFGAHTEADKYVFDKVDGVNRSPENEKWAREIFAKYSLPADAANEIVKAFEMRELEGNKARLESQAKADAEADKLFDTVANRLWGDKKNSVLEQIGGLIAKDVPPDLQPFIKDMDPKMLLALGTIVDSVHQRYGADSSFLKNLNAGVPYSGGNNSLGNTLDELSTSQRKLMVDPDFRNPMAPRYQELQKINSEIRTKMTALFNKSS